MIKIALRASTTKQSRISLSQQKKIIYIYICTCIRIWSCVFEKYICIWKTGWPSCLPLLRRETVLLLHNWSNFSLKFHGMVYPNCRSQVQLYSLHLEVPAWWRIYTTSAISRYLAQGVINTTYMWSLAICWARYKKPEKCKKSMEPGRLSFWEYVKSNDAHLNPHLCLR